MTDDPASGAGHAAEPADEPAGTASTGSGETSVWPPLHATTRLPPVPAETPWWRVDDRSERTAPATAGPPPPSASHHPTGQYPVPPYPYPGQPYPGQYPSPQYPGQQPYPGQPYPGQPYQAQPYPAQPYPGQPYPPPQYPGRFPQYPGMPGQPGAQQPGPWVAVGSPDAGRRPGTRAALAVVAGLAVLLVFMIIGGTFLLSGAVRSSSTSAAGPSTAPGADAGTAPGDSAAASGDPGTSGAGTDPGTTEPGTADPGTAPSATTGGTVMPSITAHQAGIEQLQPGDCIQDIGGTHISKLPVVDCSTPHQVQLAGVFTPQKGPYPGQAPLVRVGDNGCAQVVRGLLRPDAPATTSVLALVPAETVWRSGDRRILCFAASGDNSELTRSVLDTSTT